MNQLDKTYKELLENILENGVDKMDRTGTGTRSIFGEMIKFDMREGFPLLTTKKMYWKGMVTELLWFLKGDTNIKWLVDHNCNIWNGDAYKHFLNYPGHAYENPNDLYKTIDDQLNECPTIEIFADKIKTDEKFAKRWGELGPIYGHQWRNWENPIVYDIKGWNGAPIDQIQNAINTLRRNPDDRRIIINSWNVAKLSEMVLPPCHYSFQLWSRELTLNERAQICWETYDFCVSNDMGHKAYDSQGIPKRGISLAWNQRSCDVPLGIPFNIASYGLLLHIIGRMVNMIPLELTGFLGDCHIYSNQMEGVKEQITREGYELPKLEMANNLTWNGTMDEFLNSCLIDDFQIREYKSCPSIKFPLSN